MITVKLVQLKVAESTLRKIAASEMPVKISYKIGKVLSVINDEIEFIEKERQKLFDKYGIPSEDQTQIVVPQENMADFNKGYGEILDIEIGLEAEPLDISEFPDSLLLSPAEIDSILFLLKA